MTTILEKTTGLVAFVRTVESGSFSAASRLAGSSQSAIKKSVAALERRLGVKLIQYAGWRIAPVFVAMPFSPRCPDGSVTFRARIGCPNGWTATVMHDFLPVGYLLTTEDREIAWVYSGFPLKLPVAGRADHSHVTNSCSYCHLICDGRIMSA